jgi:hypothetical protein
MEDVAFLLRALASGEGGTIPQMQPPFGTGSFLV